MVRSGQVHPRELVELYLGRIESLNPRLNAFRVTLADEALAAADGADLSGPLAGVPVAMKDDTPVAGQAAPRVPELRATRPRRRRGGQGAPEAGAIPIGITNVPELTICPWTASAANGVTRNPWVPGRTPGGSSWGSACGGGGRNGRLPGDGL